MRADALLIDFDGVFRHWPLSDAPTESVHGLPIGAIRKVAFADELLELAITGVITDEEWRSEVSRRLAHSFPSSTSTQAVAQWSRSLGEIDADVLRLLRDCNPSLRVVLASNATTRLSRDLAALDLTKYFHAVANSSQIGVAKPREEFFRHALRLADTAAERAIYVDDSPENVAAAEELGIVSRIYTGFASLRQFLCEEGLLGTASDRMRN